MSFLGLIRVFGGIFENLNYWKIGESEMFKKFQKINNPVDNFKGYYNQRRIYPLKILNSDNIGYRNYHKIKN